MGKAKTKTGTGTPEGSGLMSYTQVAIALGVSESAVSRKVTSGRLSSVRIGARRLVPAAALEEYISRGGIPAGTRKART